MTRKTENKHFGPEVPRFVDFGRNILQAKSGPKLFGTVPLSVPLPDAEAIREVAEQAALTLPLNEAQKEQVIKQIVYFAGLVQNQMDAGSVRGLIQLYTQGIRYVPGEIPETPGLGKGKNPSR